MTELFPKILAGCIVALFGWLLKMSYAQRRFRINCLTDLKKDMGKFKTSLAVMGEQVKDARKDIDAIFERLNKHINGSTK